MKRLALVFFLAIGLMLLSKSAVAQYLYYEPLSKPVEVENGWYKATVKYTNTATYTKATYTLKVKIVSERL